MRLQAGGLPRAILEQLVCGPLNRNTMQSRCESIAPGKTSRNMTMKRLMDSGLMVLEYRLTRDGQRALEESKP